MVGQDPTSDRPQPPVVWTIDETAEILGRPQAGKTSEVAAIAAQLAATGRRTGVFVIDPKARLVVVVDDGGGMPPAACAVCGDPVAWHPPHALVAETVNPAAGSANRASGAGAVSQ